MTFFPFPMAKRGVYGTGEACLISFAIPQKSMDFWIGRLNKYDILFHGPDKKFGFDCLSFSDPDGLRIELVEDDVDHLSGWETQDLPRRYSIKKFFGTTICLSSTLKTENLLKNVLGFKEYAKNGNIKRFTCGEGDHEARFDIRTDEESGRALQSAGSIHHIAWRTESDESQKNWLKQLRAKGFYATDIIDRKYFRSVYFREPGGVLFEIATDEPGFMIDEKKENLGNALKLPPIYESRREEIEGRLIPISQDNKRIAV